MVNIFTNIYKTKESLNIGVQHFHQYQLTRASLKNSFGQDFHKYQQNIESETVMVNNSTNINKTKESLNSDGQQFHQYQQYKRKFKQ
jgi:hypothetical protein